MHMSATDHDFDVENYPRWWKLRLQLQERLRGSASLQECYSCFWHTQSCPQWIYTYPQIRLSSSTVTSSGQQCNGKHWKKLKVFKMQDFFGLQPLFTSDLAGDWDPLSQSASWWVATLRGIYPLSTAHKQMQGERKGLLQRNLFLFYYCSVADLYYSRYCSTPIIVIMSCFQKLQQNNSTSKNGPYYLNPEKNLKIINILMYDVMLQSWSFGTAWWGLLFFDYSAHSLYTSRTQK